MYTVANIAVWEKYISSDSYFSLEWLMCMVQYDVGKAHSH